MFSVFLKFISEKLSLLTLPVPYGVLRLYVQAYASYNGTSSGLETGITANVFRVCCVENYYNRIDQTKPLEA